MGQKVYSIQNKKTNMFAWYVSDYCRKDNTWGYRVAYYKNECRMSLTSVHALFRQMVANEIGSEIDDFEVQGYEVVHRPFKQKLNVVKAKERAEQEIIIHRLKTK